MGMFFTFDNYLISIIDICDYAYMLCMYYYVYIYIYNIYIYIHNNTYIHIYIYMGMFFTFDNYLISIIDICDYA